MPVKKFDQQFAQALIPFLGRWEESVAPWSERGSGSLNAPLKLTMHSFPLKQV